MGQILARVTGRGLDGPRGPDVSHRIKVPREWLESGGLIEVELPRHLRCAACQGGGCDTCERSGALTLRGRQEPAEIVEVTLPRLSEDALSDQRPFVIRIPEQGGLPPEGEELPRGLLLLAVEAGEAADPSVRLVETALAARTDIASSPLAQRARSRELRYVLLVAAFVLLWVLLLLALRLSGRG